MVNCLLEDKLLSYKKNKTKLNFTQIYKKCLDYVKRRCMKKYASSISKARFFY